MNRWTVIFVAMLVFALAMVGCSGGSPSPVAPTTPTTDLGLSGAAVQEAQSQTHLWGYYDCYIDIENQTVEAVENRSTAFAANVVQFVNGSPANLSFSILGTPIGTDYIDVDINVSIKHPFPGMAQYNGYDVRGVFCGDGSGNLDYNGDLDYPMLGTDQIMIMKPGDDTGAPDGYTRWFNKSEFGTPGLGGYTPGLFASAGFNGSATLMPYKYFADGLGTTDDLWEFLMDTDDSGVFSAGKTNTRNYYLRFPNTKGVKYGYAIVANWIDATTHPANAPEPVGCMVDVTDDIYYVNNTSKGGDLIADISLWGWATQPDAIYIESNMFALHQLDATEMTPIASGTNYATYHIEIPTTNLTGTDGNEFWVIAELDGVDYTSDIGVPNSAGTDNLAGFFRNDVYVADTPYNQAPIVDTGVEGEDNPLIAGDITYTVTAHDPDGDPLTYSWSVSDGLLEDDPGNSDGTIDINFGDLGAEDEGVYDIDCTVSDGMDSTDAVTLTVTVTAVIYLYDGTVDDGDMAEVGYTRGSSQWTFLASDDVWDENGNISTEDYNMFRSLGTPELDIPDGVSHIKLELTHSLNTVNYYSSYSYGSAMVGYTTNAGTTMNWNMCPCSDSSSWLTFDSGTDFNFPSYYYGNLGVYGTYDMGCDAWGYWVGYCFCDTVGSTSSPAVSTWTCDSLMGQSDVQILFNYAMCQYSWIGLSAGWHINKVKVYIVP